MAGWGEGEGGGRSQRALIAANERFHNSERNQVVSQLVVYAQENDSHLRRELFLRMELQLSVVSTTGVDVSSVAVGQHWAERTRRPPIYIK